MAIVYVEFTPVKLILVLGIPSVDTIVPMTERFFFAVEFMSDGDVFLAGDPLKPLSRLSPEFVNKLWLKFV